jgi:hypothetical protein
MTDLSSRLLFATKIWSLRWPIWPVRVGFASRCISRPLPAVALARTNEVRLR